MHICLMYASPSTRELLAKAGLDLNYLYLHYSASVGDLWYIGCCLKYVLGRYNHARILVAQRNIDLLKLFLGSQLFAERVGVIDEAHDKNIRGLLAYDRDGIRPPNDCTLNSTRGVIRPCHTVFYPYFIQLYMTGHVSYFTLLKNALGIPDMTTEDLSAYLAGSEVYCRRSSQQYPHPTPSVLFNPINFSHKPLSISTWKGVKGLCDHYGIQPVFNVSQTSPTDAYISNLLAIFQNARTISIPLHLMSRSMSEYDAVIGVDGGAMSVAAGFTDVPIFVIGTPSVFFFEYWKYRSIFCANPYADEYSLAARGNFDSVSFVYASGDDNECLPVLAQFLERHFGKLSSL